MEGCRSKENSIKVEMRTSTRFLQLQERMSQNILVAKEGSRRVSVQTANYAEKLRKHQVENFKIPEQNLLIHLKEAATSKILAPLAIVVTLLVNRKCPRPLWYRQPTEKASERMT